MAGRQAPGSRNVRTRRWWQTWPAIVLGLLLCLPVGLVGLWTRPGLRLRTRGWGTAAAAAFLVLALAMSGGSSSPDNAAATSRSSPTAKAAVSADHHSSASTTATVEAAPTAAPTPTPTPELATVPDLAGLSRADALAALQAAGLSPGPVTQEASEKSPSTVLRQGAGAGTQVQPGSTVDLVIAVPLPRVPAVVGLRTDAARERLQAAGYTVTTSTTPTTTGDDGVVLSQQPSASTRAARGTAVHLQVSELHQAPQLASNCTPGYSPCLAPASDYDCAGGSGNGPEYADGPIRVTGSDPYGLDADHDGIGCE